MAAMGLLAIPDAYAGPPALPPGKGRRIVIIGAGIAGMVLAWELRKAGYRTADPGGAQPCRRPQLDAARAATRSAKPAACSASPGTPARTCISTPARRGCRTTTRASCRTAANCGVPLEVMSNDNRGALLQSDAAFDGRPQRNRQVVNDIRGYVAELAAKAIDHDALTQAVTTEDKERIRALLRSFGALDQDMTYKGSGRAGYSEPPGGGIQAGTRSQPLDLHKILDAGFWQFQSNFGESWHQAATMMQPVGGMGRIGEAFGRELGGTITYGAEVRALRRSRRWRAHRLARCARPAGSARSRRRWWW